jgi:hypothetical protein
MTARRKTTKARGESPGSGSVLEAIGGGVDAARLALARRLASEIDDPGTPAYARGQLARVLADLLDRMQPDELPGVDVRALLQDIGHGRN